LPTPRRQDQLGVLRIDFNLPPQPAHDRVHRAIGDIAVAAPHFAEQRIATEHDAWTPDQQVQQVELLARDFDQQTADSHLALVEINPQRSGFDEPALGIAAALQAILMTEQRADPRDELARPERFRQVIVRAALEAEHPVRLDVARRHHQDRRERIDTVRTNRTAEGQPIEAGQHDVENEDVERSCPGQFERPLAVADLRDVEARDLEVEADDLPDRGLVFDKQCAALAHAAY
jgi:hypothetical protein